MQSKKYYQTIIKLNNTYNKPNLFMIHPGDGGCEVYTSLADKLTNDFSCYGIDHYNLYSENKITNLHKLAQYYLSYIEKIMKNQQSFNLLGWSLGGQIALEIAAILEKKGYRDITVYLLDTFIPDKNITILKNKNTKLMNLKIKNQMIQDGYDISYVDKIISNLKTERKLSNHLISSKLQHTNILLFKAMVKDLRFEEDNNNKQENILPIEYNHIDKIISSSTQLKLIKMYKVHHWNILKDEKIIIEEIRKVINLKRHFNKSVFDINTKKS